MAWSFLTNNCSFLVIVRWRVHPNGMSSSSSQQSDSESSADVEDCSAYTPEDEELVCVVGAKKCQHGLVVSEYNLKTAEERVLGLAPPRRWMGCVYARGNLALCSMVPNQNLFF